MPSPDHPLAAREGKGRFKAAVMFSRASDLWATPREFFQVLHAEFDFMLDLAATRETRLCPLYVGPDHQWGDKWSNYLTFALPDLMRGIAAFLNPPYSQCCEFIAKAAQDARGGATVVCLVPSRTDTRWWHAHVWDAEKHQPRPGVEIRFIKGRLKFGNSENSAPFPSVVIVFRPA